MPEISPKKTGFIMINNECETCPSAEIQMLQSFDGPVQLKIEKNRITITKRVGAASGKADFTFVPSKAGLARVAKAAKEKGTKKM